MYYSIEKIENIWKASKPLYFRITEGEKKTGLHRFTEFFDLKKGEVLDAETREKESEVLYDVFLDRLSNLNDGIYTVSMQANKFASESSAPFTFTLGNVEITQKVGSTQNQYNEGRNFSQNSMAMNPMLMMFQMMQQQNQQMIKMQQDSSMQMMQMIEKISQKDIEIQKATQKKGKDELIMGVLMQPHVWNTLGRFAPPQPVGVGRAMAEQGETVQRDPPKPDLNQVEKLKSLLEKVSVDYPDRDPIDVLNEGFEVVQNYLQKN